MLVVTLYIVYYRLVSLAMAHYGIGYNFSNVLLSLFINIEFWALVSKCSAVSLYEVLLLHKYFEQL